MKKYNINFEGKFYKKNGKKVWRNWDLILKDIEGESIKAKTQYLADQCETVKDLDIIIEDFGLQIPKRWLYQRMKDEGISLPLLETKNNIISVLFGREEKIIKENLFNYYAWLKNFLENNPDVKKTITKYNKKILANKKIQEEAQKQYEKRIAVKNDWKRREQLLCQMIEILK
jgi:hypothetical protein